MSSFELNTDRKNTRSYKIEEPKTHYNDIEKLPRYPICLGCADFEYDSPKEVQDFVEGRAKHHIYGYTLPPPELVDNIKQYYAQRHNLLIEKNDILTTGGVLVSICGLLQLHTQPGDTIVLLEPEYPPFFAIAKKFNLKIEVVRMEKGQINFDILQQKVIGAKVMMLSNPHNPTGTLLDIDIICNMCKSAGVMLLSDEIWADF